MLRKFPENLFDGYSAIKNKIDNDYNANQSIWAGWWNQATIDTRLEAGEAGLQGELGNSSPFNPNTSFFFNCTRPMLGVVSGYQRRNRKSTIVIPSEFGDQATADQWTKVLMRIYKNDHIHDTFSDAFYQGALVTGLNMLHAYLDWSNDPLNGDVRVENCSYNSIYPDPYVTKKDFSDASFIWRRSYLNHSAAASLYPEKYDEIMSLPGNPSGGAGRDNRFMYMPQAYGRSLQNVLAYDEYYYRDYRKQVLLFDTQTGETREDTGMDRDRLVYMLEQNPQIQAKELTIPTVRMAILIQNRVFFDGPNSLNIDCYPLLPVLGFFNPMMPYFSGRIQGLCRSLRDPQTLLNRRLILNMDIAESMATTGYIYREGTPLDTKVLFHTGQGRMIPLKKDASMDDIRPIPAPQVPPSFFEIERNLLGLMPKVTGINEELMGAASDDIAGITSVLKQGAGLTTLQPLFDNLDNTQILLGELIMKIVRANYTPGKIKSLLGGEQPAPLFYNQAFGKYNCMVESGLNTESQKQMQFAQYYQMRQLGINIDDASMIEASTIQNKTELVEQMKAQQQQAAQQAQQQSALQMAQLEAQVKLANARALADIGLGVERESRVQENQALAVERQAEARKDDQMAVLNFVKALKELENIDINQIQQIVTIQGILKQLEQNNQTPSNIQKGSDELDRGQTLKAEPSVSNKGADYGT